MYRVRRAKTFYISSSKTRVINNNNTEKLTTNYLNTETPSTESRSEKGKKVGRSKSFNTQKPKVPNNVPTVVREPYPFLNELKLKVSKRREKCDSNSTTKNDTENIVENVPQPQFPRKLNRRISISLENVVQFKVRIVSYVDYI